MGVWFAVAKGTKTWSTLPLPATLATEELIVRSVRAAGRPSDVRAETEGALR